MAKAEASGWTIDEDQLDDRHIIRRMVLKRCVYGVDKNPMAVELAKVALWLHTFTVGAPLSSWITTCAVATACSGPGYAPVSTRRKPKAAHCGSAGPSRRPRARRLACR